MTNILRSTILDGIRQRAAAVMDQCRASRGGYLDVYVCYLTLFALLIDSTSRSRYTVTLWTVPATSSSALAAHAHSKTMTTSSSCKSSPITTAFNVSNPITHIILRVLISLTERWIQHYSPLLNRINTLFKPKSTPLSKIFVLERSQNRNADETSLISRLWSKTSTTTLTPIQIAAECMDHLAAGIDTTGDGLCFLMHELSLPPNIACQRRLQEEISNNPTAKLDELVYLDAVIKEGLRLFPPIPMSLPRYVPREGRTVCGYDLPGGSVVSCQPYSLHLLNEDVYPRAETFVPERWLEKEGEVERNRLFFAFASGGRGCIGKK